MINKLFYSWIMISIVLLSLSWTRIDDKMFLPSLIIIIVFMVVLTYFKTKQFIYILRIILGTCIFSILSSISLLDNYISSIAAGSDGITISNKLAYLYIGEDQWSTELFRSTYEIAFHVSVVLCFIYVLGLIMSIGLFREQRK